MNDLDFHGKIAVVTGGASGIGRATVEALIARGGSVALLDKGAADAEEWINKSHRSQGLVVAVDVSDSEAVQIAVDRVANELGGIDLLCHCAGIQSYGNAESTTVEDWRKTLAVDLDSAFYMAHAVIPFMKRRDGGSIVLTGSTQSLVAHRNSMAYVAGKHGLLGVMRSIAVDFASFGIRCNCVLPGAIDTPMIRWSVAREPDPERVLAACSSLALLGRMGRPEEAANLNIFLLSEMASYITGAVMVVDGGQLVPCGGTGFQRTGTGGDE